MAQEWHQGGWRATLVDTRWVLTHPDHTDPRGLEFDTLEEAQGYAEGFEGNLA